jgi:glucan phosphorylase
MEVPMKVSIKSFDVDPIQIKTNGIELDVYSEDGNSHLGDVILTKAGIIWCKGRTHRKTGKKLSWDAFAKMMAKT